MLGDQVIDQRDQHGQSFLQQVSFVTGKPYPDLYKKYRGRRNKNENNGNLYDYR